MGLDLGSIIGGSLGSVFKEIVGAFKADPTIKAQLQEALDANAQLIALKQIELQEKLQDALSTEVASASANIQADAKSGDKFTSRARPMFMYVCELILFWNYLVVPLTSKQPVAFPEPLFWLFGSAILGYTGARTWEKIQGVGA